MTTNHHMEIGTIQKAYAKSLRHFRQRASYSQEAVAHEAGINRTHMYKLENGLTNPTLYTMLRLCDVLGVTFTGFAREFERSLGRRRNRKP